MADLRLENISKTYGNGVQAVKNLSLHIADKEFIVLVGPSGCGKSTVLRMIAGLEPVTEGRIEMNHVDISDKLPRERNIAMIFQNYALYPHMNVYDNMAFCLKMEKKNPEQVEKIVFGTAKKLGITHLLKRKPETLSGGEKQRVAMGRAIVRKPELFLMDEPLSNLDTQLRAKLRREIALLYKDLQTTIVYVTHDQIEAMTLGTKIIVMKEGTVQQIDTPENIYLQPENIFVAEFIGTPKMNFIKAIVMDNSEVCLKVGEHLIGLNHSDQHMLEKKGYVGKEIILGVRSEDIHIKKGYSFKILDYEMQGANYYYYINMAGTEIIAAMPRTLNQECFDKVQLSFNKKRLHLFDLKEGRRIKPYGL